MGGTVRDCILSVRAVICGILVIRAVMGGICGIRA